MLISTKKLGVAVLTLALALGTVIPTGAALAKGKDQKSKDVLTVVTPFKQGHILADASEKFKEIVEKESKGKIKVVLEEGLDTEEGVNNRTAAGTVDIQVNAARPLEVFAPQYFFFNGPYVIKDYDHFLRVWNGKLGREAQELVKKNGNMRSLGTVYRGQRQTTSNQPITGPNDLIGLKLRLPVVPTWISVWESLGVQAVPVPLTDLYQALKDGRAEASEGDLSQVDSFKLNEVQSHIAVTNHLVAVGWAMMNEDSFKRFKEKDRKMIARAMKEATDWASQKMKSNEDALLQSLKAKGMTITTPDAAAIREKAKPAVEELFRTQWPVTTWEEVLAQ